MSDQPQPQPQLTYNPATAPERWTAAWSKTDVDHWLSLYTPDATYIDHAFLLHRTGPTLLKEHHEVWRGSNPDFIMAVSPDWPILWLDQGDTLRASFRTTNTGTNTGSTPKHAATDKKFHFIAVVDLVVRKVDGLIVEVQEWYTRNFEDGLPVDKYYRGSSFA